MITAIVLSIILVLIYGIRVINSIDAKRDNPVDFLSIVGVLGFSVLVGVLVTLLHVKSEEERISKRQPTAIDVYKGKTTLRVTYIDSIATDSVVVFKGSK